MIFRRLGTSRGDPAGVRGDHGRVQSGLPDWSGQWENVGATPDATGGFNQSLEQVLKQMQWSPPLNPATKAKVDAMSGEGTQEA